jgi:hypothetical protein
VGPEKCIKSKIGPTLLILDVKILYALQDHYFRNYKNGAQPKKD